MSLSRLEGSLVVDGISYIPSSALSTGIQKLTFKDNRAFGVLDSKGEAPRAYAQGSELGLYCNDTRHLGVWEIAINGSSPVALANELRFGGSTLVISMSNKDFPTIDGSARIPRDTFLIRRILTLQGDTLFEALIIRSFSNQSHVLQIEQWAGTRFDDVFEVRGFVRQRRGKMLPSREIRDTDVNTSILEYVGLDDTVRKTYIHRHFRSEKIRVSPALSGYFTRVEIAPKSDVCLKSIVSFDRPSDGMLRGRRFAELSIPEMMSVIEKGASVFPGSASVITDNAIINRAIHNAQIDLKMLLSTENSGDASAWYLHAGIPWFSAPFGRDGLISAYQMLPWNTQLARGVLEYVFSRLGSRVDDFTEEQPGRVFHEMRWGEMARTREVPFIPYYGSADATPLSLILLHEYISWTMDMSQLRTWWPAALRALEWIERWGDSDGDGFIEYICRSPTGLVNQGWKDSGDSVMHADGSLARAPIRLCEIQGYSFRALKGMAALAYLMKDESLSSRLRMKALKLKAHFSERFWNSTGKYVYFALDGNSAPCDVRASNMGHCLWSQILSPLQARETTQHLMSEAMFSGYGIRTLADTEVSYNPLSYHNGSVWPHDNSIIMEGFRNYGQNDALERLSLALIGVLEMSRDFRLPELYCGFRKRGEEPPVPYEVACKPQAWSAGSVFLMLKSMLGMTMDPDQNHIVFHSPTLTPKINTLEIQNLKGRDWEIDILLRRSAHGTNIDVTRRSGKVRVLTVK